VDADGVPYTIRRGARLRGDHPAVLAAPWNYVLDSEPDPIDFVPDVEEPGPMFDQPTKVRVTARVHAVHYKSLAYKPGQEFVAAPKAAQELVEAGHAEVA
jgi:hypothetical protein